MDFRFVFDHADSWFVKAGAAIISQAWHKRLLSEVMVAKDKFLRVVCRKLRTPMHGILGCAELLAEELKSSISNESANSVSASLERSPVADRHMPSVYLNTIKTAGPDLVSIVNNMMNLNNWADIAITDRHSPSHIIDELRETLGLP